jgi:hypothetical protein
MKLSDELMNSGLPIHLIIQRVQLLEKEIEILKTENQIVRRAIQLNNDRFDKEWQVDTSGF